MLRNNFINIILLFSLTALTITTGCHKKGNLTENKRTKKILLAALKNHNINYDFYSSKANVDIKTSDFSISVGAQLRVKKDGPIWFMAKKFGFEIVRGLVTQDTVKIMDRFHKKYMVSASDKFTKMEGMDDIIVHANDYLIGNIVIPNSKNALYKIGDLTSSITIKDSKDFLFVINNTDLTLSEMSYIDGNRMINIKYQSYEHVDGEKVPTKYDIEAYENGELKIELKVKLSDVDLHTKKKMSFSIPKNYERTTM